MTNTGMITKVSSLTFDETYSKLKGIITNNPNLKVLFELDHQANAANADLTLPPTKIIFFGNPKLGTPLMANGAHTGLDLPQKMLVQEVDGKTTITYNDPAYLKERHNITGQEHILEKVTAALDKISNAATSNL